MNYPRIVRIESAPHDYDSALAYHLEWRTWGVRLNTFGEGVGAVLLVCRADDSREPIDATDWRARFELTIWDADTRRRVQDMGLPAGGLITLETDRVQPPENARA